MRGSDTPSEGAYGPGPSTSEPPSSRGKVKLSHEADMLRRAATACRNFTEQAVGNKGWFGWVPIHLDALATRLDGAGTRYEVALRCTECGHFLATEDTGGHDRWHEEPRR